MNIKKSGIVNSSIDESVTIVDPCNIYGAIIKEYSFVGPFVEIQKDVRIGKNTRIQSHSFVCSYVELGDNVFIGHGVMFINDPFKFGGPARGDESKYRQTKIHNNVSIGSNATIMPVIICENAVIGAGSVVVKDILEPGIYVGNPARLIKKFEK